MRYCLTLGSDTRLPRDAAKKLIGVIAHPLNRPHFDVRLGRVTEGYGILQPRVSVTMASAAGLWVFDAKVVDGAVSGAGWLTIFSSWFSHLIDKYLVDGLVNVLGAVFEESSFVLRRVQTGLIQNYALVMLLGVFAFVSMYLFVR